MLLPTLHDCDFTDVSAFQVLAVNCLLPHIYVMGVQ